jgi:hypothetical protein
MGAQVAHYRLVDIELWGERNAKARAPALRRPALVDKDVGLERAEAPVAGLGADRPDSIETGDRRLVKIWVVDAPSRAMRPVDPHSVPQFAAEEHVARHLQRLGFGVEQSVLDGAQPLADDPAGGRPSQAIEFGVDSLVIEDPRADDPRRQSVDDRADPWRAEPLVELAPSDDAFVGRQLEEMIIPPARVVAQDFETGDFHRVPPFPVNEPA